MDFPTIIDYPTIVDYPTFKNLQQKSQNIRRSKYYCPASNPNCYDCGKRSKPEEKIKAEKTKRLEKRTKEQVREEKFW